MSRATPQLICFSYHKSGTTLFFHVMTKVCERLNLTLVNHYCMVDQLDLEPDVFLLPHSLLRIPPEGPYRAIRLIRDPRDVWVSGYLYHLRCDEKWCLNTNMELTSPIGWPQVDYSVEHWPEDWKRRYLERLDGKSYQQNLLDRSLADGLDFELGGYTACTFAAMREWSQGGTEALDIKLEDVMADFDGMMSRVFDHFGFTRDQRQAALEVARTEDIRRMDDSAIAERPQINSRTISKWRDVLSPAQIARFEQSHGDLIRELGYEPASAADCVAVGNQQTDARLSHTAEDDKAISFRPRPTQRSRTGADTTTVPATTRDAAIRLLADGIAFRPTVDFQGTYSFVVPSGRSRVRLESRSASAAGARTPDPCDARRRGVGVNEITIRSDASDIVIAADDPSLIMGWHEPEYVGSALWRWTDGSAEIPWDDVSGPAVVTVRCTTLGEYPADDQTPRG
jgi:hypothetical protein